MKRFQDISLNFSFYINLFWLLFTWKFPEKGFETCLREGSSNRINLCLTWKVRKPSQFHSLIRLTNSFIIRGQAFPFGISTKKICYSQLNFLFLIKIHSKESNSTVDQEIRGKTFFRMNNLLLHPQRFQRMCCMC